MRSEAYGSGRKSSHNVPTRKTLTFLEQGSFRLSLFSSGKSNDQMGLDKFFVTSLTSIHSFYKTWHSTLFQRAPNTQIDAWFWSQQGRRALALVLFPSHQRPMPTRWQRHHNGRGIKFWVINHSKAQSAMNTPADMDTTSKSSSQWDDDHNGGFVTTTIDRGFNACLFEHICFPAVNRAC